MPSSCSIVFRAYQQEPVQPSVRVNTLVSFRPCSEWSTATHLACCMHLSQKTAAVQNFEQVFLSYTFIPRQLCTHSSHLILVLRNQCTGLLAPLVVRTQTHTFELTVTY